MTDGARERGARVDHGSGLLAGFERLLIGGDRSTREARWQREREVLQFLIDELLAEPEPYLAWLFTAEQGWWVKKFPNGFLLDAFRARTGRSLDVSGPNDGGTGWLQLDEEYRAPAWVPRMNAVWGCVSTGVWMPPVSDGTEVLPPRWAGWWTGSREEALAVYYVAKGGAPAEDYQAGFWEGDPSDDLSDDAPPDAPLDAALWVAHCPPAAEFVFRGGLFEKHERAPRPLPPGEVDLSAAVAHGVWHRREHTWCDTPVGGPGSPLDSPPVYSRTARGLLRLPNLCPECERFFRAQIGRPGSPVGGLRAFAALQLLDAPAGTPPAREGDLALLEDAGVMLGDVPLPASPDDQLFGDRAD